VKARVERTEKSIESVGEGIVVGAGFAVGGLGAVLSRFPNLICPGRLALKWRAGLSRRSAYVTDYFTLWGTPVQLVGGTVSVQMAAKNQIRNMQQQTAVPLLYLSD
jgi:hypothetical protein